MLCTCVCGYSLRDELMGMGFRIDDKAKTLGPRNAPCGLIGKQALARCRVSRMLLVRLRQIQIATHVPVPFGSILHG